MRFVQFKSKHFELVARCLNQPKNKKKVSEIIVYLDSQLQRFFANVSLNFSNSNNRRMTFAHVAILLSSTQRVVEYLFALKHFDYSWSLGYKQPITSKTAMTSPRRNECYQRPKTSWFDFVFNCAFKNKHWFENFFALIMEGIGTLWLFKFGTSQNNRDVRATISHSVSIFLLNAS